MVWYSYNGHLIKKYDDDVTRAVKTITHASHRMNDVRSSQPTKTCTQMKTACKAKTSSSRQKVGHFADIFKCIFLNGSVWIPIKISPQFVAKHLINNIPPLVKIMAWRRPGDNPLYEPTVVSSPAPIWVTLPQWFKLGIQYTLYGDMPMDVCCSRYIIWWWVYPYHAVSLHWHCGTCQC